MIKVALLVKLEAKAGQAQKVADFLKSALPLVEEEPDTVNWYAIRISENIFGIFDTFPGEDGRQAHLTGKVAQALMANAAELLAGPPGIERVEILTYK